MLKICIIPPKGLPVPSVKGGAIESLITDIINQNEIDKKLDITVFSIYNSNALEESKKYKMTSFGYVRNDFKYKLKAFIVRIKNLFGKNLNTYNEIILDKIKQENFDYIVVEDGAYFSFESYLKYYKKDQLLLHFHHSGISDEITDNTFSTFIGVSDFVTNKFKNSSKIENCVTLKNGINLSRFQKNITEKEKNDLRKKLNLNKDDFVVLFCGRLVKEKGILELVKAIKNIDNNNIKLLIVGSINFGNLGTSDYLRELNEEINTSNTRIKTTGFVNYNEVYKYYKISDISVIPSIWEDAAPLVNIESMACGVPTIVTNTGGAVEYVSKETIVISKENLIDNLETQILNLYNDKNKRNLMSKEGIKTSEKYSTQNFYDNFVNILESREK